MQVIIRNFQSIKEAKLNIKGFTLLVGESSSGKSACMRALYSSTHNRFRQGHVRYGEDEASVLIRFPEESNTVLSVSRPWSGSIKMQLGKQQFSKINRTVPKEISEFLNFGVLDVSGDNFSLNFHDQFQKPLLLEYSQKKVMDILSASKSLDDLHITKDALSRIRLENSGAFKVVSGILDDAKVKLSNVKSVLELSEPLFEQLENESSELEFVESTELILDSLVSAYNQNVAVESRIESYHKLITSLSEICSDLDEVESTLSYLAQLNSIVKSYDISVKRSICLSSLVNNLELLPTKQLESLNSLSYYISTLESVDQSKRLVHSKIVLFKKGVELEDSRISIDADLSKLSELAVHSQYQLTLDKRILELKDIVEKHICPLCHSVVK